MIVEGETTRNEIEMIQNIIRRMIPEMMTAVIIVVVVARSTNEAKGGTTVMIKVTATMAAVEAAVMTAETNEAVEKERTDPPLEIMGERISTTVAAATIAVDEKIDAVAVAVLRNLAIQEALTENNPNTTIQLLTTHNRFNNSHISSICTGSFPTFASV